jgi:hypothetical protein
MRQKDFNLDKQPDKEVYICNPSSLEGRGRRNMSSRQASGKVQETLSHKQNVSKRAGVDITLKWKNTCLSCARPLVQPPVG